MHLLYVNMIVTWNIECEINWGFVLIINSGYFHPKS